MVVHRLLCTDPSHKSLAKVLNIYRVQYLVIIAYTGLITRKRCQSLHHPRHLRRHWLPTADAHRAQDGSVFHEMIILSEGFQHIKKEIHELLACIAFSGKAHGACGAAHTSNSDPRMHMTSIQGVVGGAHKKRQSHSFQKQNVIGT